MRKINSLILLLICSTLVYGQNYMPYLKKLNDYLVTFDNGYYGSIEIKNGYFIDNFKSGKYTKTPIKELGFATLAETESKKVIINCKNGKECVFSTYTDSYHNQLSFSQSTDFNTNQLVTLLNNLLDSYNGKSISTSTISSTTTTNSTIGNTNDALKKINDYLKTFDNGYYGYLEINGDYLIDRFPSGKYTKTPIKELGFATLAETESKKVIINCKNGKECVFSTYTDSYHNQLSFSQSTDFNTNQLITLLNNLLDSYNGKSMSTSTISSATTTNSTIGNTNDALKKLNDYLKTFDNGYYGYFEIKDGYIYDRFKAGKYNKFKMEDISGSEIQTEYKRVIFKCKGGDKCISTDWKENGKEDYTQFTTDNAFNYQELAILLNNFRDAYLSNNTSISPSNDRNKMKEDRDAKAKERLNSSK